MSFSRLANVLWAVGFIGNSGLLSVLIAKSRWKQFPVFTVLSGFTLLKTAILFGLSRYAGPPAYYYCFWGFSSIDVFLQVLLVLEITNVSLRPKGKLLVVPSLRMLCSVVAGVSLTLVVSMAASPPLINRWELWELRMSLFASLIMCELCAALTGYANRLGLQWKAHALAITQGYTACAVIAVVADAMSAATGWHRTFTVLDEIRMVVYIGALMYWSWALSFVEQKKPAPNLELVGPLSKIA